MCVVDEVFEIYLKAFIFDQFLNPVNNEEMSTLVIIPNVTCVDKQQYIINVVLP